MLTDAAFYRVGDAASRKDYKQELKFTAGTTIQDTGSLGLDFVQLPCVKPEERHPSNFNRRFFRETDRTVYALTEGAEKSGQPIKLGEGQQVHFMTAPLPDHLPVGAVRVDMKLNGIEAGRFVSLTVQDPLIGNQELMHFDVQAGEHGRVQALLDFPDQILPRSGRIWITLGSDKPATLDPSSTFSVLTVDESVAKPEHIAWRLFLLKGYFYTVSEARPFTMQKWDVKWLTEYDGKEWRIQRLRPQILDMYRTVEHLREVAPDHPIAVGQYYRWLNRGREDLLVQSDIPEIKETPGVPRWATLVAKAAETIVAIPDWWIQHRMSPHGELGGNLADDCDFYQWWVPSALMDSEGFGKRTREKFEVVAEVLKQHHLRDGINRRAGDPLHAYEEGQDHFAIMPLLFYGDPYYVEELMIAARTVDKMLYRTPEGTIRFGVTEFGWPTANPATTRPVTKAEQSSKSALFLHSHLMLAWYNHNPHAVDVLKGFADDHGGWVEGAYGAGPHINFAVYWITGDPKYLGLTPDGKQGRNPWARFQPLFSQHGKEAKQQPWWPAYESSVGQNWNAGWWAWATGHRIDILEKSLIYEMYGSPTGNGGGTVKFLYMWTEAEKFTDRVFLASETIAQAMLGGATVRDTIWPAYAVSYEELGGDFAALVLEQGKDRLKVAMVNLRDQPRTGGFRVWQLEHGRYELTIGPEGQPPSETKSLELARMDRIDVTLPPKQVIVYDLKQIEKLDDICTRADLAIGKRDVTRDGDAVTVIVHNIGSAAATGTVALVDDAGKVVSTSEQITLEAPLDMVPRTTKVSLKWAAGATAVVVDPGGDVPEITELNNRASLGGGGAVQ
jgi:hypothetical protein